MKAICSSQKFFGGLWPLGIILLIVLLKGSAVAQQPTSIRKIDFKNFSYPFLDDPNIPTHPSVVNVKNGLYEDNDDYFMYFRIHDVVYGDLDKDKVQEAAVVAEYGGNNATFFLTATYIYKMRNNRPVLLGAVSQKQIEEDYFRFCRECGEMVYEAVANRRTIKAGMLTVTHFAGGSHGTPRFVISLKYRWNGKRFVLAGPPRKREKTAADRVLGFQEGKG